MSKKLLLADDSITIQKVIGITFANEDVDLAIADNGDTAIEMARDQRPDLILADVLMPGKNGYELCEAVKRDSQFSGVPVLLLTGTFEPFDEDKARACGADDWIAKPFESQALIDKVHELLERAPDSLARPADSEQPVAGASSPDESAAPEQMPSDVSSEEAGVWGEFSFDEEELAPEAEPPAALYDSGQEPSTEMGEPGDDEILELDEADILEQDLEQESDFDLSGKDFQASDQDLDDDGIDDFGLVAGDMEATSREDVDQQDDDLVEAAEDEPSPLTDWDDDDLQEDADEEKTEASFESLLTDEQTQSAALEAEFKTDEVDEPSFLGSDEGEDEAFASQQAAAAEPARSESAPQPQPAMTTPQAVAPQLDEERIEAIVQKVADEVVNRLAGSILEKVAWEVVPDLAESLIKDEIRKIKDALK